MGASMWGLFGIIAGAVVIVLLEVPQLRRQGYHRELIVFSILLILGVGAACAKVLNAPIPNPDDWVAFLLHPLSTALKPFIP
ncbi:hypothetical protein [Brevibacillus choshinensis]|nr:hypothetical protein [Brevibacillus choshinensis]